MELNFEKYKAQQFCDNLDCDFYGKTGENNIRTHTHQVYCNSCKQIWVLTKGTFFYNLKAPVSLILAGLTLDLHICRKNTRQAMKYRGFTAIERKSCLEVLKLLSEGMGLRGVSRSKGVTADAISAWVLKAAAHVKELTVYLERDMHLTQCQVDEFWSYILKKSASQRR